MDSEIIISINLLGRLGSRVKHTTKQNYSVKVTGENGRPEIITRKILHTNRTPSVCVKEIHISPFTIKNWVDGPCPRSIDLRRWKKFNSDQKIAAHVVEFDEGLGVKYE